MAVRVKVKVVLNDGRALETVALVNTGFETPRPQLLLPVKAAQELGIWPDLPSDASVEIYDTAGGPTRVYVLPHASKVSVLTSDGESGKVLSDIVISHVEVEALIGDKLAEELSLVIEAPGRGLWRFRNEKVEKESEEPVYWL
ncbi:hypothetical protein KEJ25_09370 [Candidatus Bathyarchaeota archaeon]|nr:hypothetical protein [Candidatus Bathyarchaeota archaeon]